MTDFDIYRSANTWITRHGDQALHQAKLMAGQRQQAGDRDGADVLLRLIVAIQTLQACPKGTLH